MFLKLDQKKQRYQELEQLLGDSSVINDQRKYQKLAKEFSDITPIVELYRTYQENERQINELEDMLKTSDPHDEFVQLALSEAQSLRSANEGILPRLRDLVYPKIVEADRDLIIEIRAGTGGQEASLFASDLFRMYTRYAERKGWITEVMSSHESETGGFKEIIFSVSGPGSSRHLKWESGVHRVQRVPATETQGRVHTSAATVAVLYEPEDVEIVIDPKDLRIDIFRSSGPGGQSVNTTDSAVRITHLPTGIVVICQDERSQLKNKAKAMRVLRARLLEKMERDQQSKEAQDRKAKIGTGDRSEKIRTYNYPERRVTDHRIGLTLYQLPNIMDGDLDAVAQALMRAEDEAVKQNECA
jgi:peptide chain release factor 1